MKSKKGHHDNFWFLFLKWLISRPIYGKQKDWIVRTMIDEVFHFLSSISFCVFVSIIPAIGMEDSGDCKVGGSSCILAAVALDTSVMPVKYFPHWHHLCLPFFNVGINKVNKTQYKKSNESVSVFVAQSKD